MTKSDIYKELISLLSPNDGEQCDKDTEDIVIMLCNYFDSNELTGFVEFIKEERNG